MRKKKKTSILSLTVKKYFFWITLALLVLFILDLSFMLFSKIESFESPYYIVSDNILMGYEMRPYSNFLLAPYDDFIQTNSLGFRDDDLFGNSKKSIIMIGDSVVFGLGLPENDTIASQLEALLSNYSVLNTGVPGYNLLQETALLEKMIPITNPEIVIVVYSINDIFMDNNQINYLLSKNEIYARNRLIAKNLPLKCQIRMNAQDTLSRSVLFKTSFQLETDNLHKLVFATYEDDCNWNQVTNSMDKLAALAEKNDFKVVFVLIPMLRTIKESPYKDIYSSLQQEAENRGFITLNMLKTFASEDELLLRAKPNDFSHPSAFANSLLVDELLKLDIFNS